MMARWLSGISTAALALVLLSAWTYPEHRDISAAALERLSPARQDVIARMWTSATGGSQPLKNAWLSSPSAIEAACSGVAIPEKRQWPALELRTRHGRFSPSSARA